MRPSSSYLKSTLHESLWLIDIEVDWALYSVTTTKCKHLVVDAGHISIVSDLASKEAIRDIHSKRNKQYTQADYEHLESMMYDRLSVKLEAAQVSIALLWKDDVILSIPQFLIGDDLNSCLKALRSKEQDNLHLLERTNFDLQVQNSIVPTAYSLARFKLSGHLPTLQVNMSDTKYKALMRLINVAIPHFDDETGARTSSVARPSTTQRHPSAVFKIPTGFFGAVSDEYAIETDEEDNLAGPVRPGPPTQTRGDGADEEFFEADPGAAAVSRGSITRLLPLFIRLNASCPHRTPRSISMWLRSISRLTRSGPHYTSLRRTGRRGRSAM